MKFYLLKLNIVGLDLTSLHFLINSVEKNNNKETVLSLGNPTIHFTRKALNKFLKMYSGEIKEFPQDVELNGKNLFKHLGYKSFLVLDINNDADVDIVWDLNYSDNLPDEYLNYFDLLIDPGTLQHVFDIRSCLDCIKKLTKLDGYIYHISPGNNYIDHGFYQISPTLFQDYYYENQFKLVSLSLQADKRISELIPYKENIYRNKKLQNIFRNNKKVKVHQIVQKKVNSENKIPIQHFYSTNKTKRNPSREYIHNVTLKESRFKKIAKKFYLSILK